MTTREIAAWSDLSLTELFYAFRKAKADCYFDYSLFIAREFVEYESDLPHNLDNLLVRLHDGQIAKLLHESLGKPRLIAKKLATNSKSEKTGVPQSHGFFSDPRRAFHHLSANYELTPEFRLVGDFPVQMHILSALWINLVGHKFDQALTKSAYGSRLRRYRAEEGSPTGALGPYHTEGIGSFQPYFAPYRQWRERGLKAIRNELSDDKPVIAITMDLTSYYHRIDPTFMADRRFLDYAGIELTKWETEFTATFAQAMVAWSNLAHDKLVDLSCISKDKEGSQVGGLPIGLTLSRIVSNALLIGLDREIEQQLSPVYYGRYVDDIFVVLRDPETIRNFTELQSFIASRTKCFPFPKDEVEQIQFTLPGNYQGKTSLILQRSKQKVFFLSGRGGLDLLDSIESQIRSVSSERRLMPSPEKLETMAAAKVLAAAGQASEEADTLRRADGLSVRRLGWSVLLRAVETLAKDLRHDDWKLQRDRFYTFALSHILRPDKIFDHLDYLPRLLSLAVALTDWPDAKRLFDASINSLSELEKATSEKPIRINGYESQTSVNLLSEWDAIREGVRRSAADAVIRSLRWGHTGIGLRPLPEVALRLCELVGLDQSESNLREVSLAIRECDWAKSSYKDHLRRDAVRQRPIVNGEGALYDCYERLGDLLEFVAKTGDKNSLSTYRVNPRCSNSEASDGNAEVSLLPYLLPTRPYTTEEISLFLPKDCVFVGPDGDAQMPARNWARYVRALRGVWVWESLITPSVQDDVSAEKAPTDPIKRAVLYGGDKTRPLLLGVSSLLTTDATWDAAASGSPDLSIERYQRIEYLVNQAIQARPRPTHLLLPELSLPERWLNTVSSLLKESRISLIAGLDYHIEKNQIHSEAALVLEDDRLGFHAYVRVHQPKTEPAPGEDQRLVRDFGKAWVKFSESDRKKVVYQHNGFTFGVLVCSELQNVEHRLNFQGAVDCVMVLSWNQDLETFSALVESASLDVHAYIVLVNNRRYGDSRVRAPTKANYARDLCRLRGGENEHVVVAKLDVDTLRRFQSRAKSWPSDNDPFKPVPEGFEIKLYRAAIPL